MAINYKFNNRNIVLPGVYSSIRSAVSNPPLQFPYGNILIIDKLDNEYGGGFGIKTASSTDPAESVYSFDNLQDFRSFVGGGLLWDIADSLFIPSTGFNGISNLIYTRALETIPATLPLTFTGGGANGGNVVIRNLTEGKVGNGFIGDAVEASQTLEITSVGALGDEIQLTIDADPVITYTSNGTDTLNDVAEYFKTQIQTNYTGQFPKYRAEVNGAVLIVYASKNLGTDANSISFSVSVTGTATATVGGATFLGGATGTKITRGFGVTAEQGVVDTSAIIIKFWRGGYKGVDSDGDAYQSEEIDSEPSLIVQSDEFTNIQEFIDWMDEDASFKDSFALNSSSVSGTGAIDSADLTANAIKVFGSYSSGTDGTQTYDTARIDEVLEQVNDEDYTFVFSLDAGSSAKSADNGKIFTHISGPEVKYEKYMIVAGGDEKSELSSISIDAAKFYDSKRVMLIHGGIKEVYGDNNSLLKDRPALYNSAYVLGRMAGLAPQDPVALKSLGYTGAVHTLTRREKESAIENGVIVTGFNSNIGSFVVELDVNTLQGRKNKVFINPNGDSYIVALERISAQLSKTVSNNLEQVFLLGQESGPNRSSVDDAKLISEAQKILQQEEGNLVISHRNYIVTTQGTAKYLSFEFVPNSPIYNIFVTAFVTI